MTDQLTMEQMMDLQQRIQAARNGEGEMPSREELLACYTQLRQGRAAAASKKTAPKGTPLPTDLNDLFA